MNQNPLFGSLMKGPPEIVYLSHSLEDPSITYYLLIYLEKNKSSSSITIQNAVPSEALDKIAATALAACVPKDEGTSLAPRNLKNARGYPWREMAQRSDVHKNNTYKIGSQTAHVYFFSHTKDGGFS